MIVKASYHGFGTQTRHVLLKKVPSCIARKMASKINQVKIVNTQTFQLCHSVFRTSQMQHEFRLIADKGQFRRLWEGHHGNLETLLIGNLSSFLKECLMALMQPIKIA